MSGNSNIKNDKKRIIYTVTLGELAEIPGTPFAYWAPKSLRELFLKYPPLDRDVAGMPDKLKIADVKVGLQTSDDLRFTRYWWEVPFEKIATSKEETLQGKKWVPFAKGGKPFYHDIQIVVNWENNGKEIKNWVNPRTGRPFSNVWMLCHTENEFFFREGLAWANVVSIPGLALYVLQKGCIFAVTANGLFSEQSEKLYTLLSIGNSSLLWSVFKLLDPTAHMKHVGYVSKLPISPQIFLSKNLIHYGLGPYNLLREWATGDETSTVFIAPWILQVLWRWKGKKNEELKPITNHPFSRDFQWQHGIPQETMDWIAHEMGKGVSLYTLAKACTKWERWLRNKIEDIQHQIDSEVYKIYGISEEDRKLIEKELGLIEASENEKDSDDENIRTEESSTTMDTLTADEHIKRLIHYIAQQVIREDPKGIVPLQDGYTADQRFEPGLISRIRNKLNEILEGNLTPQVEQELQDALGMSLDLWLSHEFFRYHLSLYRQRPIIWQIIPPDSVTRGKKRDIPEFSVFIYWHKLDNDTLNKVRSVYLPPYLTAKEVELRKAEKQLSELREAGAAYKNLRDIEKKLDKLQRSYYALKQLASAIDNLLHPLKLNVQSNNSWMKEKVNEIISEGYKPNLDYGVRVNIEPLKQAGILHPDANRIRG
ncbi:MAG: hypothetical protein J7L55_00320 [Desulfurococcales archaeon]|nr:hypothetical protein [Desulfurococcales archaeon]